MEESKELNAVIDVIMLAGTILLKSGSEIHRVEDTMIRIAHSQGIVDCNVLAMPAAIFFSIENTNISRMKRVTSSSYNIEKVCDVNQISRQLVGGQIDLETAFKQLTTLQAQPLPYTKLQVLWLRPLAPLSFQLCLVEISMTHSGQEWPPYSVLPFLSMWRSLSEFPL